MEVGQNFLQGALILAWSISVPHKRWETATDKQRLLVMTTHRHLDETE
jgi:hypothetical protein